MFAVGCSAVACTVLSRSPSRPDLLHIPLRQVTRSFVVVDSVFVVRAVLFPAFLNKGKKSPECSARKKTKGKSGSKDVGGHLPTELAHVAPSQIPAWSPRDGDERNWRHGSRLNSAAYCTAGVTEVTTCQDVVFALAHATGKTGRFTLIERWRNNERLLAPHENPLKILMKWGEYSSDVQFILQRSEQKKDGQTTQQQQQQQNNNNNNNNPQPNGKSNHPQSQQQLLRQQQKLNQLNGNVDAGCQEQAGTSNNLKNSGSDPSYGKQQQQQQPPAELITNSLLLDRGKETRKSLNSGTPPSAKTPTAIHTNTRSNGTAGATTVVKVVDNHAGLTLKSLPPQQQPQKSPNNSTSSSNSSSSNSSNNPVEATYASVIKKPKGPAAVAAVHPAGPAIVGEFNAADLRNSLDRKLNGLLYSNGVGTAIHHGGGTTIVGATLKDSARHGGNVSGHQHLSSNDSLLLDSSSISSVSSGGNHTLLTSPTPQNLSGSNNASPITGISSNGALVPPPYRDPPPPRNSPLSHKLLLENQLNNNPNASISSTGSNSSSQIISPSSSTSQMNNLNVNRKLEKDSINMNLALAAASAPTSTGSGGSIGGGSSIGSGSSASNANELLLLSELNLNDGQTSSAAAAAQYRDLVQLIKYQREKINTQQADLSKSSTFSRSPLLLLRLLPFAS
ncbi:hypothetical protein pipiens_002344 [Culex pipiens pipiens]|uniref:Ras-associating domain-containing protein n=1 Tax=Culex pipiens pipiens TaxID=38569 RepID=A0ABD1DGE9_CULPP